MSSDVARGEPPRTTSLDTTPQTSLGTPLTATVACSERKKSDYPEFPIHFAVQARKSQLVILMNGGLKGI
jgi:hypothetical protein